MSNKRVSELAPITMAELQPVDLLLLADVSSNESKKLTIQDVSGYILTDGSQVSKLTGSLFGTASWAVNSKSASYLIYTPGVFNGTASYALSSSISITSSFALYANSSSAALNAVSASWALSSSYALSASYVFSSSYANTSTLSEFAKSASYLIYTPGVFNGTASYALSSSVARSSSYALSSSYARSSSYAFSSSYAITASYVSNAASADNGVFQKNGILSYVTQSCTGFTEDSPDNVPNLIAILSTSHDNPYYLINISIAIAKGGGCLWRSSSLGDIALINTIGFISGGIGEVDTLSATYIDHVAVSKGSTITYRGRVYENTGSYYIHQSINGLRHGTSSLSIIEF